MEPGKSWTERLPRILDLIDTPSRYGTPYQILQLDAGGRKLEWATISDAHYPNALLRDGTRSLLGNLAVEPGITIDGVDLSDHSGRHSPGGADPLPTASAAGLTVSSTSTEGAAASFARADHTHQITTSSDPGVNASILASNAGGWLALVRLNTNTLGSIGNDLSIVANQHIIFINASAGASYTHFGSVGAEATATLFFHGGTTQHELQAKTDGVLVLRVPVDKTFRIANDGGTAIATFNNTGRLAEIHDLDVVTAVSTPTVDATSILTLAPGTYLDLDPVGKQARALDGVRLQSDNYASQTTGWGIDYGGGADFRYLFADQLHAKSFIADLEQALAGGQIIAKSVAMLSRDFTAPAAGGSTTLYVRDLPSAEGMAVFQIGDTVRLRTFSRAGGALTIADCWGTVVGYTDLPDGEQAWAFTRSTGGDAGAMAASTVVKADTLVLDYGNREGGVTNGFYEVNAIDGLNAVNSPYAQTVVWTGHPATGQVVRTRMGNLRGITATTEYGLYAGEGLGVGKSYLLISDQNVAIHDVSMAFYDSGNNQRIGIEPDAGTADMLMWAGASSSDPRFVVYGDGEVWLSGLALSRTLAEQFFTRADGVLLLNGQCEMVPGTWTSLRGYTATLTGAFHTVPGLWGSSRALMIEPYKSNLITNPSFEVNVTDFWSQTHYITKTREEGGIYGRYCMKAVKISAGGDVAYFYNPARTGGIPVDSSTSYTLSAYIKTAITGTLELRVQWYDAAGAYISRNGVSVDSPFWARHSVSATSPVNAAYATILFYFYGTCQANEYIYVDAVQLELGGVPTTYIDGSLGSGYAWGGTPHNSTSTRANTSAILDSLTGIASGKGELTFSVWVQPQYAYDEYDALAYNPIVFDLYSTTTTDRIYLWYSKATYQWSAHILGVGHTASATFKAGEWTHLVLTLNATTSIRRLYVNGELAHEQTSAFSAPSGLNEWCIGAAYNGASTYNVHMALAEYAVFQTELTAEQVAALYHRGNLLTDVGGQWGPGIYIHDGQFSLATGDSGARTRLDKFGWWAYDEANSPAFGLSLADNMSWGGFTINKGDLVLGNNVTDSAAILWDRSTGKFGFYGDGGATPEVQIDTDGTLTAAGGDLILSRYRMQVVSHGDGAFNMIEWINTETDDQPGCTGFANFQATNFMTSNKDGLFDIGMWHDANNQISLAFHKNQATLLSKKAGSWRYLMEFNHSYIRIAGEVPLVLGARTTDPTVGVLNGTIYYNSSTHKFRGLVNGTWVNLN